MDEFTAIVEAGMPFVLFFFCVMEWRALTDRTNQHIEDLREIAGLKQRLGQVNQNPAQAVLRTKP